MVEPSKYYCDEGVPALRSLNVESGRITAENLVFISAEANEQLQKSRLAAGDLVAVRSGQVGTVLIRLAPKPTTCSGPRFLCIKLGIGRCGDVASNAEQGAESVERVETTIEAEREFVEVGLQVLRADAVMNPA